MSVAATFLPYMRPPPSGSSPISHLPDEVWLEILSFLEWEQIIALRGVSQRMSCLALSPSLHQHFVLPNLPNAPLPQVLYKRILPLVRHLTIRLIPSVPDPVQKGWQVVRSSEGYLLHCDWDRIRRPPPRPAAVVMSILTSIPPDRLLSLSIPFPSYVIPWHYVGPQLGRVSGCLERLDLRNAGLTGHLEWMKHIGAKGNGLRELDLSGNLIASLPLNDLLWDRLESLSLRGCFTIPSLGRDSLAYLLSNIPPSIRTLDLSDLQQLELDSLYDLKVTTPDNRMEGTFLSPTALRCVRLIGIDKLTRSDVRALERHWAERRGDVPVTTQFLPSPAPSFTDKFQPPIDIPVPGRIITSHLFTPPPSPPTSSSNWRSPGNVAQINGILPPSPPNTVEPTSPCRGNGVRQDVVQASSTASDCANPDSIRIIHSAILESDDEAGYRQFIGEVVSGTLDVPEQHGLVEALV